MPNRYPSPDESFDRRHRAGWSIGETVFAGHWQVSGASGENVILATGRTQIGEDGRAMQRPHLIAGIKLALVAVGALGALAFYLASRGTKTPPEIRARRLTEPAFVGQEKRTDRIKALSLAKYMTERYTLLGCMYGMIHDPAAAAGMSSPG